MSTEGVSHTRLENFSLVAFDPGQPPVRRRERSRPWGTSTTAKALHRRHHRTRAATRMRHVLNQPPQSTTIGRPPRDFEVQILQCMDGSGTTPPTDGPDSVVAPAGLVFLAHTPPVTLFVVLGWCNACVGTDVPDRACTHVALCGRVRRPMASARCR